MLILGNKMIRPQTTTREYCLEMEKTYWKWNWYVKPLTESQITRNFYHAKAFYNIHSDLLEAWKAIFKTKLNLSEKDCVFLDSLV